MGLMVQVAPATPCLVFTYTLPLALPPAGPGIFGGLKMRVSNWL